MWRAWQSSARDHRLAENLQHELTRPSMIRASRTGVELRGRPVHGTSSLAILRVEAEAQGKRIVHIRVDGVRLKSMKIEPIQLALDAVTLGNIENSVGENTWRMWLANGS